MENERGITMLKMLEGGVLLEIMIGIFVLGLLDKLLVQRIYQRLVKQSDNMQGTKNHYLKQLKLKFESSYRVNAGINNIQVYVEKQLSQYRFLGSTLRGIDNFSSMTAGLTVLLGIVGSLGAYWYGLEFEIVVLHTCAGVILGIAAYLWDNLLDVPGCRENLVLSLCDYFQNVLLCQLSRSDIVEEEENGQVKAAKERSHKDIEYLKKSLNQIAASLEEPVTPKSALGKLSPQEEQVIKEIIKEYLS